MKNLMKKVHNRKGFTLIELIIVIVIIAILAAIAIPAVSKYVGDAKDAQRDGNLAVVKSAAGAAAAYATTSGAIVSETFEDEIESILTGSTATAVGTPVGTWKLEMPKITGSYEIKVSSDGAVAIKENK